MSTLDVPAAIASSVNLPGFCELITLAGLIGRFDAGRRLLRMQGPPISVPGRGAGRDRLVERARWGAERAYWLDVVVRAGAVSHPRLTRMQESATVERRPLIHAWRIGPSPDGGAGSRFV